MSTRKGTLTKQPGRWNPILDVRLSASGRGGCSNIDTAEIDTVEGLIFSFRLSVVAHTRATCVSHSTNYHAEYPLHRKIYQRALQVAILRLRAEQKKEKQA